jgi:hypothetical protein
VVEAEYSNESWKTTLGSQNPNQNQRSENPNKNQLTLSPGLDEEGVVVDEDADE